MKKFVITSTLLLCSLQANAADLLCNVGSQEGSAQVVFKDVTIPNFSNYYDKTETATIRFQGKDRDLEVCAMVYNPEFSPIPTQIYLVAKVVGLDRGSVYPLMDYNGGIRLLGRDHKNLIGALSVDSGNNHLSCELKK